MLLDKRLFSRYDIFNKGIIDNFNRMFVEHSCACNDVLLKIGAMLDAKYANDIIHS
jgi:hypothetical protein